MGTRACGGFVVEAFRFQGPRCPINRIHYKDPSHHAGWSQADLNRALLWLWDQDQVLPIAFNDPATHDQLVEFGGRQSFYWVFIDHWAGLDDDLQDLFHIVDLHDARVALGN